MHFATGFRIRRHRAPDDFVTAPMPSGYYTGSGLGAGYIVLKSNIDLELRNSPLTAEMVRDAMVAGRAAATREE